MVHVALAHCSLQFIFKSLFHRSGMSVRKIHTLMNQMFEPPEFLNIYSGDRGRIKDKYQDLLADRITRMEADFRYYPSAQNQEWPHFAGHLFLPSKLIILGLSRYRPIFWMLPCF